MFCFFLWYFPVIKKLSALFLVCRIIKLFFVSEKHANSDSIISGPSLKSASSGQRPASRVQSPASRAQSPESSVQNPASRVQSPASNSCVQNTGIPVCRSRDMLNFNFSEKGLGLVSPPHFVRDYSRQMFLMLHSIKGTLMQIGKSQYMFVFTLKNSHS